MRDANVYGIRAALPRMSWHPKNLFNLYQRTVTKREEAVFTQTSQTLFQQRWASKRLTRAYHGDFINEKIFKRWYLPRTLPDVRPRRDPTSSSSKKEESSSDARNAAHAGRFGDAEAEKKRKEEEDKHALAPVASLMYAEVERRIDVFIFRCCFAHSVYEARRLVIHGYVTLNGQKHQNANTRLAPGDMVHVDPSAIWHLQPKSEEPSEASEKSSEEENVENNDAQVSLTSEQKLKPPSKRPSVTPTPFHLPPYASPWLFIPAYIEVSFQTCTGIYVRHPTARFNYSEIPSPYEADGEIMRLSWEWYNRVRPRVRGLRRGRIAPEVRKETRVIPLPKEQE